MSGEFNALALDYDGTLAHHGAVDAPTVAALERWKGQGKKLLMVTGREMPELLAVFPKAVLFDLIVAENGALIYTPRTRGIELIAPAPPKSLGKWLTQRHVPFSQGAVVVATREPHHFALREAIHELQLDIELIFNKGAVMALPCGVDKGTGLAAAARRLDLPLRVIAASGDAENDFALSDVAGYFAAVANAIDALKARSDLVLRHDHGAGVVELINLLLTPMSARALSIELEPMIGK